MNTNVVVEKISLADIEPASYNPRVISDKAMAGLQQSILQFGLIDIPVVNKVSGPYPYRLIGGHQRASSLKASGFTEVDCIVVELDENMERAANLTLNNPAIQGRFDLKRALPQLEKIAAKSGDVDVSGINTLLNQVRVNARRLQESGTGPKVRENQKDATVVSVPGTIYRLGQHRLACGSSADDKLVASLIGKGGISALVTDPPYNVAYRSQDETDALANDDMDMGEWVKLMTDIFGNAAKRLQGPAYIFSAAKTMCEIEDVWKSVGGEVYRWLVWNKQNAPFVMGRNPHYRHALEWCMCGYRGALPSFPVDTTNVLVFKKNAVNKWHPTQKPEDLMVRVVQDAAPQGSVVYDPCSGSGTTLIACENTGRACRAVEYKPGYSDIIRRRWAEHVHGPDCDWVKLTPKV